MDWSSEQKTQAAMITRMDRDIGRILSLVEEIGQDERTLIIFTSDNGPHGSGGTLKRFDAAGPLRGKKGSLYEGGIRVPFVARWPGRIEPGSVSHHVSGFQDVMPTCAEIAGTRPPEKIDGISFLPTLAGDGVQEKHEYLYWELGGKQAVRMAEWKAVRNSKGGRVGAIELYRLSDDLGESINLAAEHPEVVQQMQERMRSARRASKLFPSKALDR
jgi:arylsulfatase A-like enzyme